MQQNLLTVKTYAHTTFVGLCTCCNRWWFHFLQWEPKLLEYCFNFWIKLNGLRYSVYTSCNHHFNSMHVHTTRHDNYFLRRTCVNNQSIWMVLPLHDLSKLFALRFSIFVPLPSKMRMKLTTGLKRYLDELFCIAITINNAFFMK